MIRALLILPSSADMQTERCARTLATSLGDGFAIRCARLGAGRSIADRGLRIADCPDLRWRNIPAGALALRRLDGFDFVYAWGTPALLAAALGSRRPILFSPIEGQPAPVRWLRAIGAYRDVQTICASATMSRALVTRGVPADRVHIVRPGVDFSRVRRRRDPALRAALGFGETDRVLLAVGESTRPAAHELAAWVAALLHEMNPQWKLLTWGRGDSTAVLGRRVEALHKRDMHRSAEKVLGHRLELEELLPAADMLLVTARDNVPTLPIAIGMAAALPIVATAVPTVAELLEDHHTAILVPPDQPRLMAQRILELNDDSTLQWRLADTARTEAYEYFPQTRFLDQYRAVYKAMAEGRPIEISQRK